MALHPCRECGTQVSTDAKACPRCGATDPLFAARARGASRWRRLAWGVASLVAVVWLLVLWGSFL